MNKELIGTPLSRHIIRGIKKKKEKALVYTSKRMTRIDIDAARQIPRTTSVQFRVTFGGENVGKLSTVSLYLVSAAGPQFGTRLWTHWQRRELVLVQDERVAIRQCDVTERRLDKLTTPIRKFARELSKLCELRHKAVRIVPQKDSHVAMKELGAISPCIADTVPAQQQEKERRESECK